MKKVLILGVSGQLGHRLFLDLKRDFKVTGAARNFPQNLKKFGVEEQEIMTGLDVTDQENIKALMSSVQPDIVINCIGVVKQRKDIPEDEFHDVNTSFPHYLAHLAEVSGFYLIHFSTDCVFSGKKGGYLETDPSDVEDLYGVSKFEGEVIDSPKTLTLRTSIIGREIANNTGLVEWFLAQPEGATIQGFTECVFSGLPTHTVSRVVKEIVSLAKPPVGLYHLAAHPVTKFALLSLINDKLKRGVIIRPTAQPVIKRDLNGARLNKELNLQLPRWDGLIEDVFVDFEIYEKLNE